MAPLCKRTVQSSGLVKWQNHLNYGLMSLLLCRPKANYELILEPQAQNLMMLTEYVRQALPKSMAVPYNLKTSCLI